MVVTVKLKEKEKHGTDVNSIIKTSCVPGVVRCRGINDYKKGRNIQKKIMILLDHC